MDTNIICPRTPGLGEVHHRVLRPVILLIALRHGGKLVTFDGAVQKRLSAGQQPLVEVIR
jgi:hypothetical protein